MLSTKESLCKSERLAEKIKLVAIVMSPWLPIATMAMYALNWTLLWRGYAQTAHILGRTIPQNTGAQLFSVSSGIFSIEEKLSFFLPEMLFSLLFIPLIFAATASVLPRRIAIAIAITWSLSTGIILFVQMSVYRNFGHFASLEMLLDAMQFAVDDKSTGLQYVSSSDLIKLGTVLTTVLAAPLLAQLVLSRMSSQTLKRISIASGFIFAFTLVISYCFIPGDTPYRQSIIAASWSALLRSPPTNLTQQVEVPQDELQNQYFKFTETPAPEEHSRLRTSGDSFDLVIFILETAPVRCLAENPATPNLDELRNRGIDCKSHYTTYPLTNRAIFSLLTSMHPNAIRAFDRVETSRPLPGIIASRKAKGYHCEAYSAIRLPQRDRTLYRNLGFDEILEFQLADLETKDILSAPLSRKLEQDWSAVRCATNRITQYAARGDHYVFLLQPQVGHAPWPNTRPGKDSSTYERGADIIAIQDKMIGEIVTATKTSGRFDQTIFVVVGDHGLRSVTEDPAFTPGIYSDLTFHVPLVISAPGLEQETLRHPTSHIDVTPTLLAIYGDPHERQYFQGVPVWTEGLESRTLLLSAEEYLGFSVMLDSGAIWQRTCDTGIFFHQNANGQMEYFSGENPAAGKIPEMESFGDKWVHNISRHAGI